MKRIPAKLIKIVCLNQISVINRMSYKHKEKNFPFQSLPFPVTDFTIVNNMLKMSCRNANIIYSCELQSNPQKVFK